jgi:uncharacterized protein
MLFNGLYPKNTVFFDLLDREVDSAVRVAALFKELIIKGEILEAGRENMRDLEHEGDKLAYAIIDRLNKTFVTPFDREDIHSLAKKIDDINDMMNGIIRRMKVYRVKKVNEKLKEFANLIGESVRAVSCAVHGLRDKKNRAEALKCCVDIGRLESDGDKLRDRALTELFDNEKDAIEILKWKEIYQDAETVLDICKVVGHTVEAILVKQA